MLTGNHFDHIDSCRQHEIQEGDRRSHIDCAALVQRRERRVDLVLVTALQEDARRGLGEVFQNRIAFQD